jgi:hypothetical protein
MVTAVLLLLWLATRPNGKHEKHSKREPFGAYPGWSPKAWVPPARRSLAPPLDPRVALSEAERDLVKAHDRVAACRDAVEAYDRAQLARIESRFTAELRKIGQLELDTVEVSRDLLAAVRR